MEGEIKVKIENEYYDEEEVDLALIGGYEVNDTPENDPLELNIKDEEMKMEDMGPVNENKFQDGFKALSGACILNSEYIIKDEEIPCEENGESEADKIDAVEKDDNHQCNEWLERMNLLRLVHVIRTEKDAIAFLQKRSILHNPRVCGNGHDMVLHFVDDKVPRWCCSKRQCREFRSTREGTFLKNSKLPFRKIILFLYCWCKELTNEKFCEEELEINHCTRTDYANNMRDICTDNLTRNPIRIGGPNMTVEIYKNLFLRGNTYAGRVLPQQWVLGGYCWETKDCFMFAIKNRSAENLFSIIQKHVLPGTTIMSDEWAAYKKIQNLPQNDNDSYNFVDTETGTHTQGAENMWHLAKHRHKKEYGTNRRNLKSYFCEFMWRQRYRNENLFKKMLENIAEYWPPA